MPGAHTDRWRSQPHQLGDVWREGFPDEGEKCQAVLSVLGDTVRTPPDKTVRRYRLLELRTPPVRVPQTAQDQDKVRVSVFPLDSRQKLLQVIAPTFGEEIEPSQSFLLHYVLSLLLVISR